ncbi:MAG: type I 3-dehydroquinate dehydratase [Bacteroidales bacterium]|nr:type I 3-dehydroquinate dehydratase [Bacteroidales bacterium]
MICVTLQNRSLGEILDILENKVPAIQMAEIRLDRCHLDEDEIAELFSSSDTPLIATCRVAGDGSGTWEEAEAKLQAAIEAGAAFVDLEIEAPKEMGKRLRRSCSEYGTRMIRSCHFFDGTPSLEVLSDTAEKCRRFGGEIIKVAVSASSDSDVDRVLSLYDSCEEGRLVAFAMGEAGRMSRLDCLRLGAPFTYAALSAEEAAAPGQWAYSEMTARLYGRSFGDKCLLRMTKECHSERSEESMRSGGLSSGQPVQMPASKSFAQRAIIAAALADRSQSDMSRAQNTTSRSLSEAEGPGAHSTSPRSLSGAEGSEAEGPTPANSALTGYSPCGDSEAAKAVAVILSDALSLSKGEAKDLPTHIHVGESGLLTRLMIPIVAALQNTGKFAKVVEITGEGTLLNRPLKGASVIMAKFGTVLRPIGDQAAGDIKVPLSVQGPLLPGKVDISGKDGSQLISGLLMALPLLQGDSVIHVHDPKSIPYMFITIDVLKKFGIRIGSEMEGDEEFMETQDWSLCTGITFKIKGGQEYKPASFSIEGDWSAAANFLVAGAVFGKVQLKGLDTTSLQADISIMDILMDAGASLSQEEPASVATDTVILSEAKDQPQSTTGIVTAQRAPLRAFDTDLGNCPDLFPIVSVLAVFCCGTSHILGFKRLAGKESDRGKAILETLAKMGVKAYAEGDMLTVEGHSLESRILNGTLLKSGEYTSYHDHRMAMALTVASLGADGPITIDDTACVAKSFPGFFDTWRQAIRMQ